MKNIKTLIWPFLLCLTTSSCVYEPPSWTPDGKKIVVGALYNNEKGKEEYQFFSMDVTSGKSQKISQFTEEKNGICPRLSPDGSKLAFLYRNNPEAPQNKMNLCVMNASGGKVTALVELTRDEENSFYTGITWSSNGSWIAAPHFNSEKKIHEMVLVSLQEAAKKLSGEYSQMLPSWAKNENRFAYLVIKEKSYDLCVYEMKSGASKIVLHDLKLPAKHRKELLAFLAPSWAPDNTSIAYINGSQIETVNVQTGERHQLTHGRSAKVSVEWSPNGKYLAFMKVKITLKNPNYGESQSDIAIIDLKGENAKILTSLEGEAYLPRWSPSGEKIAFLFAEGDRVLSLPAVTDLEGQVQFFPVNGDQKIRLAKYEFEHESPTDTTHTEAKKWLQEVIQENPKTKWAEEAEKFLQVLEEDLKKKSSEVPAKL